MLTAQSLSSSPGGGSHNQFPGLPRAADRGWQVGGQVGRGLCGGFQGSHQ